MKLFVSMTSFMGFSYQDTARAPWCLNKTLLAAVELSGSVAC